MTFIYHYERHFKSWWHHTCWIFLFWRALSSIVRVGASRSHLWRTRQYNDYRQMDGLKWYRSVLLLWILLFQYDWHCRSLHHVPYSSDTICIATTDDCSGDSSERAPFPAHQNHSIVVYLNYFLETRWFLRKTSSHFVYVSLSSSVSSCVSKKCDNRLRFDGWSLLVLDSAWTISSISKERVMGASDPNEALMSSVVRISASWSSSASSGDNGAYKSVCCSDVGVRMESSSLSLWLLSLAERSASSSEFTGVISYGSSWERRRFSVVNVLLA